MPGVQTPALGLPYPSLGKSAAPTGKVLVVFGGSSSVGSMTVQLGTAAGIKVIAVSGAHNQEFTKRCGAAEVFDHQDPDLVEKVVAAIGTAEFAGIVDAVSIPETYTPNLAILERLGGGHLATVHPPPTELPGNVKAGMIFAVNDIATPVWRDYVTAALESGELQCLPPPTILGKGLKFIDEGLEKSKAGVSATKLVVEL